LLSFSLVWAIALIDNLLDFRYHQQVGFNLTDKLPYISLRVTRMFPSPSHHRGTGIIAQARYLIDRDCGKTGGRPCKGQLSFLSDCLPVSDCGGALLKLILSVPIWLSRLKYRIAGIVGCT